MGYSQRHRVTAKTPEKPRGLGTLRQNSKVPRLVNERLAARFIEIYIESKNFPEADSWARAFFELSGPRVALSAELKARSPGRRKDVLGLQIIRFGGVGRLTYRAGVGLPWSPQEAF
jgi:hypothetical protein